jgi:hypothetical protein
MTGQTKQRREAERDRQSSPFQKGHRAARNERVPLTCGAALEDGAPLCDVFDLHSKSPV